MIVQNLNLVINRVLLNWFPRLRLSLISTVIANE